jgi:hypothetical protein
MGLHGMMQADFRCYRNSGFSPLQTPPCAAHMDRRLKTGTLALSIEHPANMALSLNIQLGSQKGN